MVLKIQNIKDACHLDPESRTDDQINDILDFIKDVKFIAKLTPLQQRKLCKMMTFEEVEAKEYVFRMGDIGDKFYIILSGQVSVQVPMQNAPCPNEVHEKDCTCPNRPTERELYLVKGMGFGEVALQSAKVRSASIQATDKTELLVTKRTDYEQYAGEQHRQFVGQRVSYLRQCQCIEDALQQRLVTTQDILQMANCLNERSLDGSELLVRQGDLVEQMIFVRSGRLAMYRSIDLDACREAAKASATSKKNGNHRGRSHEHAAEQETENGNEVNPTNNFAKLILDKRQQQRKVKVTPAKEDIDADRDPKNDPKRSTSATTDSSSKGGRMLAVEPGANHGGKWKMVRQSLQKARAVVQLVDPQPDSTGKADAVRTQLERYEELQVARQRVYDFSVKKALQKKPKPKRQEENSLVRRGTTVDFQASDAGAPKRQRLLRTGTLGPFQYFGEHQICNNGLFPCSLVGDPVAELFVMSKTDIKRLSKRLTQALFGAEHAGPPSDQQLLEMFNQTQRWASFRRSMHADALNERALRGGLHRGVRHPQSLSHVDAAANLEFLGVSMDSRHADSLMAPPQRVNVALSPRDQEKFGQVTTQFVRRYEELRRDPTLRKALKKDGVKHFYSLGDPSEEDARLNQQWSKLRTDPVEVDLDDDEDNMFGSGKSSSRKTVRPKGRQIPGRFMTRDFLPEPGEIENEWQNAFTHSVLRRDVNSAGDEPSQGTGGSELPRISSARGHDSAQQERARRNVGFA